MDLGSGAGFPGVPLKIFRKDLQTVLYEASLKKIYFLKNLIRVLELKDIKVEWAGDSQAKNRLSNSFDFVISRAFGPLIKFCQVGLPFLKEKGILLAMKGKKGEEELNNLQEELHNLGIKLVFFDKFELPLLGHKRINIGLSHS